MKVKKVLKWIGNIIIGLLVIAVITSAYNIIRSKKNPNKVPSIFGVRLMSVLSGSMRPALQPGDMIISREVDSEDIQVGEIVTFKVNNSTIVTHRVVEVVEKNNKNFFRTKGDANNVEDNNLVSSQDLLGVFLFNIPKGGYIANFIRTPKGFGIVILLPISLLLLGEIKSILSEINDKKDDEEDSLESNEDKVDV